MTASVKVGDLTFDVVRSARRKKVEISIERDGSLVLRAPEAADDARLLRFATRKRGWVYEKLARRALLAPIVPRREFVTGESFRYLGRSYRLLLVDDQAQPLKLVEGRFRLTRSAATEGRLHFVAWYTEHATPWLKRRVAEWASRLGAGEPTLDVTDLGFRWGSCGPGGRLSFNWSTITLPPPMIDYVVVHELAHVRHAHHGAEFWAAVARAMPDHEARKRWLAENGAGYVV